MPKLKIKMETEAEHGIAVGGQVVKFGATGEGSVDVELDLSVLMVWWLMGSPGAKYKIALATSSSQHEIKIETTGWKNPIESAISTQMFDTSGHARFRVVKK
jgi:hypothetical protein